MAGFGDVNIVSNNVGALTNDFRPMFKIPTGYGGATFLNAHVTGEGSGTSYLQLVDLGTAGTAIGGTIAKSGTATVSVAGIPAELTLVTAFVDEGHWVGARENNVGATNAITIFSCAYIMGKAGS
jgi:hypothetical protein